MNAGGDRIRKVEHVRGAPELDRLLGGRTSEAGQRIRRYQFRADDAEPNRGIVLTNNARTCIRCLVWSVHIMAPDVCRPVWRAVDPERIRPARLTRRDPRRQREQRRSRLGSRPPMGSQGCRGGTGDRRRKPADRPSGSRAATNSDLAPRQVGPRERPPDLAHGSKSECAAGYRSRRSLVDGHLDDGRRWVLRGVDHLDARTVPAPAQDSRADALVPRGCMARRVEPPAEKGRWVDQRQRVHA